MNIRHQPSRLDCFPTEVLQELLGHLPRRDIKNVSCSSKRLREICQPIIFRDVCFQFCEAGFEGLKLLLQSEVHQHVVSFTYVIPELFHIKMMEFEYFSNEIIVREDYEEFRKDHRRGPIPKSEMQVPYMLLYATFKHICKEQQNILDRCEDVSQLSAAFTQLPQLREVRLSFCQTLPNEQWLGAYMDRTVEEQTFRHHLQVISNALKDGAQSGRYISTIHLSGLELPYYCSMKTPNSHMLTTYLSNLLKDARKFQLSGSGSPLSSLSYSTLNIRQLDMCHVTITRSSMCNFLKYNAKSIKCIRLHDVEFVGANTVEPGLFEVLHMLGFYTPEVQWSSSSNGFTCFVCGKDGWILLRIGNDEK